MSKSISKASYGDSCYRENEKMQWDRQMRWVGDMQAGLFSNIVRKDLTVKRKLDHTVVDPGRNQDKRS